VFAPNSKHRASVTPAKRGKGNKPKAVDDPQERIPAERRASMSWAQRLKRVFNIDIETCRECGGAVKVIACIEDPVVIKQILDHLKHKVKTSEAGRYPKAGRPRLGCTRGCSTDEPENQRFSSNAALTPPRHGFVVANSGNGADCGKKVGVFIAT
jgi:hypothetical protein